MFSNNANRIVFNDIGYASTWRWIHRCTQSSRSCGKFDFYSPFRRIRTWFRVNVCSTRGSCRSDHQIKPVAFCIIWMDFTVQFSDSLLHRLRQFLLLLWVCVSVPLGHTCMLRTQPTYQRVRSFRLYLERKMMSNTTVLTIFFFVVHYATTSATSCQWKLAETDLAINLSYTTHTHIQIHTILWVFLLLTDFFSLFKTAQCMWLHNWILSDHITYVRHSISYKVLGLRHHAAHEMMIINTLGQCDYCIAAM